METAPSAEAENSTQFLQRVIKEQNFKAAIPAGIAAALAGAVLWAVVTVTSNYKLGLMALAIGYMVGHAVRAAGHGVEKKFGYLGALCGLLGCALGDMASDIAFYAQVKHLPVMEVLSHLDAAMLMKLITAFYQPMDLLFYAIAVYEGYKFSFKYKLMKTAPVRPVS